MTKDTPSGKVVPLKRSRCPVCRKTAEVEWRPFCSKRCADIDLGRWLNESYSIPSQEELEHDGVPEEE